MIQYSIEGDIDFFNELKHIQEPVLTAEEDGCECLLSGEPIRPDAVTLICGHKFNYKPLFVEVLMQKCPVLPKNISSSMTASYVDAFTTQKNNNEVTTYNYNSSLNMETTKLSYNEIKCPYCRTVTPQLLPYYPYPDIKQVRYVNSPSNLCMPSVKCSYSSGKTNMKECNNCPTYDDTYGLLCKTHLKMTITKNANVNVVVKRPTGKSKIISKDENIIVSTENKAHNVCSYILISGNRKGCACGLKAYKPEDVEHNNTENTAVLCKRHYNKL
jgi:hypothetical protein